MTEEEFVKWQMKYAKFNEQINATDKEGKWNGRKILTGCRGTKLIYRRLTYTMDVDYPMNTPIMMHRPLRQVEMFLCN